jgi:tetratricopeptide (TPR) repeat protein
MTDAAIAAYRDAERLFANNEDAWGRAISVYGRALANVDVGRCTEARAAYEEYAAIVAQRDPRGAAMARTYAEDCRATTPIVGDRAMSQLTTALVTHDYPRAINLTDEVSVPARSSGWFDYNRAVALDGLGRTDEAVSVFRLAERAFDADKDAANRSKAIYGRARALDHAGRCAEAKRAYTEYANLVRSSEPRDAEMALRIARACVRPATP